MQTIALNDAAISFEIRDNPEWLAAVNTAREILRDVVGRAYPQVREDWFVISESEIQPVIRLKLSDSEGESTTSFSLHELQQPDLVTDRLRRVWRDVLMTGLRTIVDRLETHYPVAAAG